MGLNILKQGQGKPLIFLHGWGFDNQIWQPLLPYLQQDYQLCFVDLPGYGLSSPMSWLDFKNQLMTKVDNPSAIIGWSLGGLFAMRLILEEPAWVAKLFAVCTSPYFLKDKSWPGIEKTTLQGFFAGLKENPQQTLSDFVRLQLGNQPYPYHLQTTPSPECLQLGVDILQQWDFRDQIAHIKNGSFLFGRLDTIVSRVTLSAMQKNYPHFHYALFKHSAHLPFLSEQEYFVRLLREQLES